MLNLFPGELPVYDHPPEEIGQTAEPGDGGSGKSTAPDSEESENTFLLKKGEGENVSPLKEGECGNVSPPKEGKSRNGFLLNGTENAAVVSLTERDGHCEAVTELQWQGKRGRAACEEVLTGSDYEREGIRRRLIGRSFFLAAQEAAGIAPPWGMLSGVRPDKIVSRALLSGTTEAEIRRRLEEMYFVTPDRAAMALETGRAAAKAAADLDGRDMAVYVGIPFCPTRCAYCSFVSQSVERSFSLVPPYVDALEQEIRMGGELASRLGLRVRAFYMGGGTPTTLNPDQLRRILSAFAASFDTTHCTEWTVEAGRPDTITAEKLAVLRQQGVTRISVNPQSMEDRVLRAIGRRHTAEDVERAMKLARGFPHVNMDLIAGLPEDTPEGFLQSLEKCLAFCPDNLTIHTLALKKGSRILTEHHPIPEADAVGRMLSDAAPVLRGRGFAPYYLYRQKYMSGRFENVGWCLPGGECLYNIGMMSELCGILSFGAGGVTKLVDRRKNRITRLFHPKYPEEYISRPEKGAASREAVRLFYEGHRQDMQGGTSHE